MVFENQHKDKTRILKEKQIRKLKQGAGIAKEKCAKPDLLHGFECGMAAVLSILDQHDEDKIIGAAAFHRKGISFLGGAKREDWTDDYTSRYLSMPDEDWIVK